MHLTSLIKRQYLVFWLVFFMTGRSGLDGQITFTYHSTFSYLKGRDAASLNQGWVNQSFDDSGWMKGNAPFRYGDGTGGVEISDMLNGYPTLYLRSTFECANSQLIDKLTLTADYDDGFIVWINGVRAFSSNAPASPLYNSFAPGNHESGTGELFSADAHTLNLIDGKNSIAVQCFNVSLSSTDFYFDMALTGETNLTEFIDTNGVKFSVNSGFFDEPFTVTLSSETQDAEIVYTLDGSNPAVSTSGFYSASPVTINVDPASSSGRPATPSFIIRASLSKPGFKPSKPVSRTYIFPEKVKIQGWPGGGWPAGPVNGQLIDLEVDQRVVTNPAYSSLFIASLKDIPSISVVTDLKNLFDPASGIYVNAEGHGINWEKDCSAELINPDGSEGFNINAGLRIRGGWSRNETFPKHAFRLFFREEYGSDKLYYPLFGEEGANEFDKIDLRCEQNYAWSNGSSSNSMVREVFSRDTQRDMGQPYTRSRYYHLYLNGMYWGLYQTQERSEARFASSYLDGKDEDFDVIKVNTENYSYSLEATDGNLDSWQRLWNLCTTGFWSNGNYFELEGKDPDGKPVRGGEIMVDIDNLIDYMLVIFYTGNFDAPTAVFMKNKGTNNFIAIDNREDRSKGFVFFTHDSEHSLFDEAHPPGIGINENRVNIASRTDELKMEVSGFSKFHPQWLHYKLSGNKEYRDRFSSRAYNHFMPGAVFSPASSLARVNKRIKEVEMAVIAESARWGDSKRSTGSPYTRDATWLPEVNKIRNYFIPYRGNIVINQLMSEGLYPELDGPVITTSEGDIYSRNIEISSSKTIEIKNPNSSGSVVYTLNGMDPRKIGGDLLPGAVFSSSSIKLTLNRSAVIKTRIYNNGSWSALREINFIMEESDFSGLKVTEINYHPDDIITGPDTIDGKDLEFLEFKNTGESSVNLSNLELDSAIHYIFPVNTLLPPQRFYVIASKPESFFDFHGMLPSGNFSGNLSNAGEEILLSDKDKNHLFNFVYDDGSPWPQSADGDGYSLAFDVAGGSTDPGDFSYWTKSLQKGGNPFADNVADGEEPPDPDNDNALLVYPNPTTGLLNISVTEGDPAAVFEVSFYNVTGRKIFSVTTGREAILDLKMKGLSSGMYIMTVISEGYYSRTRIILTRY